MPAADAAGDWKSLSMCWKVASPHLITSVEGVSPEVNMPLNGLLKLLNRCNSLCWHYSTRLKGFHKPPAPLLVVSSPTSSAKIWTCICGTAFCSLIPVASPLTPPPIIATLSGIQADSLLVAILSKRGQLRGQRPTYCTQVHLPQERRSLYSADVHYAASQTAPAGYIFSQSTEVVSNQKRQKHHKLRIS